MIISHFIFLQTVVNEKLAKAPNSDYQTGVLIGSLLPFVVLIGIAYFLYYRFKNRKDLE